MTQARKGLGRGLSALIPTDDMEFLSQVARGDFSILGGDQPQEATTEPKAASSKATGSKAASDKPGTGKPAKGKNGTGTASTKPITARATNSLQTNKAGSPGTVTQSNDLPVVSDEISSDSVPDPQYASAGPTGPTIDSQKDRTHIARQEDPGGNSGEGIIQWLNPQQITANPYQPRRHFDAAELENLAESIREHGILQPIIVRPIPVGVGKDASEGPFTDTPGQQFQLVAGERRWRAAQTAAIERIPAIVREVSDQQALELAVIENVQRHDITPLDAAMAYRRLADEFHLSQERIAQRVGKSRSSIANTLRLLDLPEEVRQALNDGKLSEGHGRAILLAEGEGARRAAFRKILRDKLSVREAEELARNSVDTEGLSGRNNASNAKMQKKEALQVEVQHLAEELQKLLGCRIHLKHRQRGGQIVINYYSTDEMNRIVDLLRKTEAE